MDNIERLVVLTERLSDEQIDALLSFAQSMADESFHERAPPEVLSSGPRAFIGIMLPGNGGVFGWRPPERMLDNRSGVRDDMVARYIRSDIANVAHNRGSEKRGFAQLLHSGLSSSLRHARQIFVIILDRME